MKMLSTAHAQRFYTLVEVRPSPDGHAVCLDGRVPKTPGGRSLAVPSRALARALADEWDKQKERIRPETMPVNQLVNTALDRVAAQREAIVEQTVSYGGSDLLCYRAEVPADLVERQVKLWQPMLDWAETTLRAPLLVTQGIGHIVQPASTMIALREAVVGLNAWRLTALQAVVPALGSLVLGLAWLYKRLSPEEALAASLLDELFQAERWGLDRETRIRHGVLKRELRAAGHLRVIE